MKSLDTDLFIAEISNIAQGYKALEILTKASDLRVIDAAPGGAGSFFILATGPVEKLKSAYQNLRSELDGALIQDHELITSVDMQVLNAIFSLTQVQLEESLLVIECETASGLIACAQACVRSHKLKLIELRIHRGARAGGIGFFTGTTKNCNLAAEDTRSHLKNAVREGLIEIIENPNASFRKFFNLDGRT